MAAPQPTTADVSPIVAGVGGVVGGLFGGAAGWFGTPAVLDTTSDLAPDNLFGNAILVVGLLLLIGYAAVAGYVVGSLAGALTLLAILGHGQVLKTFLWVMGLDVLVVPLSVGVLFFFDGRGAPLWLSLGLPGALIGGVVPALARWLSTRAATE